MNNIEKNAREKIKAIDEAAKQTQSETKSLFEGLAKEIESINPALGGFDELAAILELPDDQFAVLEPIFIDELQKSFNNVSDKLVLVQTLNAAGIKVEEVQDSYLKINEEIDKQLTSVLSRPKRDFLKKMMAITYNAISDTEGIAKKVIQIPLELCRPDAKVPMYAHLSDAGMDVYATEDYTIHPGETKIIPTGLKMAIPYGYSIMVHPRSGLSAKSKMRVANSVGVIDSSFRGEVGVIIDNIEPAIKDMTYEFDDNGRPVITSILHGADMHISKGERFAQLRLVEVPKVSFYKVKSVAGIGEDRQGGFGSSGTM